MVVRAYDVQILKGTLMKSLASILFVAAATATFIPAQALTPGSALVFPTVRQDATTVTFVSVTNTNTTPRFPVPTNSVDVMAFYNYTLTQPNPANVLQPLACSHLCRTELLTPADTTSVSVGCHVPNPEVRGYLVVHAISATAGGAISHNYLVGSAQIFDFASNAIYSYEAVPFCSPLADGAPTDVAPANGQLDFNDREYERVHQFVIADNFFGAYNSRLALAEFSCLPDGAMTSIDFAVWNDNERPLSLHIMFKCWFETELDQLSSLFSDQWLRGVANDPTELDINCDGIGDFETGWFKITARQSILGTQVDPRPPLLGALVGGPRSCSDSRILWGSKERRDGCY